MRKLVLIPISLVLLGAVLIHGPSGMDSPSVNLLPKSIRVEPGTAFQVLYSFHGALDGASPTGVIRDAAGNLFGTTQAGGAFNKGTIFELSAAGQETVLYSFAGGPDGAAPIGGLIRDGVGNFYGTTGTGGTANFGTVFRFDASGKETVLHSFVGGADGIVPYAGLVADSAGNFYGTTGLGGSHNSGTVFKVDATGNETVFHTFAGSPDGFDPRAALIVDPTGNLYGTTGAGGSAGLATVFKMSTSGQEIILHSFLADGGGNDPVGSLIRDAAGNLYGTTFYGGTRPGYGVVFKLAPGGRETVLYSFKGSTDGAYPAAAVVMDTGGNFFGTTAYGGGEGPCIISGVFGCGVVFKLDNMGQETVLYNFGNARGGAYPESNLVLDSVGNLYGAAPEGGIDGCRPSRGCGTIFKITP